MRIPFASGTRFFLGGPMKNRIKQSLDEFFLLMRSIPSIVVALFILSVVTMNLLANKTIVNLEWLALDGGIIVSWLSFLTMDMVTKHFGPKAANQLNIFAIVVNLFCSLIFFLVSLIPTSDDYSGFNTIFGGTWFILLSSTVAFLVSGFLNNALNFTIGKAFRKNPDSGVAFFTRAYVSTFISQFVDNLVFSVLTFMLFAPIFWDGFSWTFLQCVTCAVTGAICELLCEVIFSPIGFAVSRKWEKDNVGKEYFEYLERKNVIKNESVDYGN